MNISVLGAHIGIGALARITDQRQGQVGWQCSPWCAAGYNGTSCAWPACAALVNYSRTYPFAIRTFAGDGLRGAEMELVGGH